MHLSTALNPRRLARSLVVIFILTFVQNIAAPIVIPHQVSPSASAAPVSTSYDYTTYTTGTTFTVPTGVTNLNFQVRGGAGGRGGDDGVTLGLGSSVVGYVSAQFAVTPGDVIQIFPGNQGTGGLSSVKNTGGGAGGASTVAAAPLQIDGSYYPEISFAGGIGGRTGNSGYSGGGGGGGAASVVAINYKVVLIAGGGGGGGGAGNGASNSPVAYAGAAYTSNGGSHRGGAGANPGESDGGGAGGGGGGWLGGAGGAVQYRSTEYVGVGGSYGGNYVDASGTSALNTTDNPQGVGWINITYTPDAISSCATDQQTNDIYTIVKVSTVRQCTWTVPSNVSVIDFFAVGGGGGGGGDSGGGGGGGAALSRTAIAVTPSSSLTLKVGYGGVGGSWGGKFNPLSGDATTLTLPSGTVFSASGGSGATTLFGGTGGAGGTAVNGGFAGGQGGNGTTTAGAVGTAGKSGISNYFYGVQNTYGGGGGGGAYTNSATQTPSTGTDGGGNGGYAQSSSVNQPGSNGVDNRGGGGGGGLATGSGQKLFGGKGGSGVILIRYATDAINAFPASLTTSLAGRWTPNDLQILDSSRKGWIDNSGTYGTASVSGLPSISTQSSLDSGFSTGSSRSNLIAAGTTSAKATFISGSLTNYTLFHIARYPRGLTTSGRLITASSGNFISGHYSINYESNAHHNYGWITPTTTSTNYKWLLSTDMTKLYRANGKDLTYKADNGNVVNASGPTGLGINNYTNEPTEWQMLDVIVFNRQLTNGEIRTMESYLARLYGLTIENISLSSDTDTAATMGSSSGNYYFFNGLGAGNTLNDTFTIEAWVKPSATCESTICQIVVKESTVLLGIHSGYLYWALNGTTVGGWAWTNTGIRVPPNEWHHVTMVKQYTGDKNGSLLFYLDGQLAYTHSGSPYASGTNYNSESASYKVVDADNNRYLFGGRADQYFYGQIDEIKIWKTSRTLNQIQSDMHSNDGSSSNLQMYYNFNMDSLSYPDPDDGATLPLVMNMASGGVARSDLYTYFPSTFQTIENRASSTAHTTITFPRTIITINGGWKVPADIKTSSTVVVGGGGGAGKSDSRNSAPGGAGGGGGVSFLPTQQFDIGTIVPIRVGIGGRGATANANDAGTRNGTSSYIGVNGGVTALGGGGGGSNNQPGAGGSTIATGGGGGGNPTAGSCSSYGPEGGVVTSGYNGAKGGWGWGGAGGSAGGAATTSGCYGITAPGFIDPLTSTEYGRSGANIAYSSWSTNLNYFTANNGWGGSVHYSGGNANADGTGGSGSAGVIIIRWITAQKPTYTKPTTAYLNAGMTETFTTNVALDSATAVLTRTFKWESTTPSANGAYTLIKQGTGAANAAFSWIPTDTSTSGSGYLYRLTVTDSDTAGLFISDSSTAYAIINQPLNVSGTSSLAKKINLSRSETYTITLGTPTYRATLSPVISGITLDTSTAGIAVLKIAETATVGIWLETLTVTDSVSASFSLPLTITVSAPPHLLGTSEVISNGLVLNLTAGNSQSLLLTDGARASGSQWRDLSGNTKHADTGSSSETNFYTGRGCTAPAYSSSNGGYLSFDGVNDCFHAPYLGHQFNKSFSVEGWFRLDGNTLNTTGVIASQNIVGNSNINFVLGDSLENGTISVAFYNGAWKKTSSGYTPVKGQWTHYVGTYDGANLKLYVNGALTITTPMTESLGSTTNTAGTWIGRRWDGDNYLNGSLGEVRVYNIPLTETQVAANFNATKYRFKDAPSTQIKPAKKYGTVVLESFTATSGYDTKTVTLSVGDRAGIDWDTSTVQNRLNLTVQESLTVGTYYDTITVTDSLGQSTYLPISFTVTKADTLTVTVGASHTTVYSGASPPGAPQAAISGLVGVDSATVATNYSIPCALGGTCKIGDIGPGGGRVFYISNTPINVAAGVSDGGIYLEAAPRNWNGDASSEAGSSFASVLTSVSGTSSAIGTGAENSRLLRNALGDSATAATKALNKTFNGVSDWFVPSYDELTTMITVLAPLGLGSFTSYANLWSSTQYSSDSNRANNAWSSNPPVLNTLLKTDNYFLRPIRAFSPLYSDTTTPIDVETYTAMGTNLTFLSGLASNYQAVVYETSTLRITQANQNKLTLNLYGAVAGSSFTIQVGGGSGTGAITETITAGSTAANCRISNHVLSNDSPSTQQLACNIKITKASSRNYKEETLTATVYFMLFQGQPTGQTGSGATIGLNGQTSLSIADTNTVQAPIISSFSNSGTLDLGAGQTLSIFGSGFTGQVIVKFWRNKSTVPITPTNTGEIRVLPQLVPTGALSGPVTVILSNGATAVSGSSLTIVGVYIAPTI